MKDFWGNYCRQIVVVLAPALHVIWVVGAGRVRLQPLLVEVAGVKELEVAQSLHLLLLLLLLLALDIRLQVLLGEVVG